MQLCLQFYSGSWFTVARLRGSGRFNSGQFSVKKSGPVYRVDYNGARKGHCLPTGHSTSRSLGGADFEMNLGDHKGFGRVIATNNNYAIVYECYRPNEDGSCPRTFELDRGTQPYAQSMPMGGPRRRNLHVGKDVGH